jgi:hypothetical protein
MAATGPARADVRGCAPAGPAVPGAGAATRTVEADLDDDGVREVVALTGAAPGAAVLSVGPLAVAVVSPPGPVPAAADVDGDGRDEVVIPGGLSATGLLTVQVWGVRDCAWAPVTMGDDRAPALLAYGSWRSGSQRVECGFGGEAQLRTVAWTGYAVSPERPEVYEVRTTAYRWVGLHLAQVGPPVVTETERSALPPPGFDCGRPTDARPAPASAPTPTPRVTTGAPAPAPPRGVRVTPRFTG